MNRRLPLVVALALLATACGRLGVGNPSCELDITDVGTATIMQTQAVPAARWGPCVADLAAGWTLHIADPKRGRAGFWLDSDRVGGRFLDVRLEESCTPSIHAQADLAPRAEIRRLVLEEEVSTPIEVTVVPVSLRHLAAAQRLAHQLAASRVAGHQISVVVAQPDTDSANRVSLALDAGRHALLVGDDALTDDLLQLRSPTDRDEVRMDTLPELLDEIVEGYGEPVYRATWWHLFEGGCITFDIDAHGPGAGTIDGPVRSAIGFYPLGELREAAAREGLFFGEEP